MFRTISRWFSTDEVKHLGVELEQLLDKIADLAHKAEGLQLKLERVDNRLRMQKARGERAAPRGNGELSEDEEALIDKLRREGGNAGGISFDV